MLVVRRVDAPEKFNALEWLTNGLALVLVVDAKINHEDSTVLAGAYNTAVIALCSQHPGGGPFLKDGDRLASLVVVYAEIQVVRTRHDTLVLGVEEERAHELSVASVLENFLASLDGELVSDVVVAASEDILGIVAELYSSQATLLCRELADAFHLVEVPKTSNTISRCRHQKVATKLDSVDRSVVSGEGAKRLERLAVPDDNSAVLGTGNNVVGIESDIEDTTLVVLQGLDWLVGIDIPNDEVVVAGTSDQNLLVVLQAKNRRRVIFCRDVVDLVTISSTVDACLGVKKAWVVDRTQRPRSRYGPHVRSANDLDAAVGVDVPHTDGAVTRTSDDLLLVELNAVNTVGVTRHVNGPSLASLPVVVDLLTNLVHELPVLPLDTWFADSGTANLNRCGCDERVLLVCAEKLSSPDKRIFGQVPDIFADQLALTERFDVEI